MRTSYAVVVDLTMDEESVINAVNEQMKQDLEGINFSGYGFLVKTSYGDIFMMDNESRAKTYIEENDFAGQRKVFIVKLSAVSASEVDL